MRLTLLGTGDSAGVPHIGCDCETCRRYHEEGKQRTRFSVLVENDGERVLIDASPDLRSQFLREGIDGVDAAVITHAHYDHYAGLGSLYRVIWEDLPLYGVPNVLDSVLAEYGYLPFPERVDVEPFEPFEVAGLGFTLLPVHHPPMETYGLVIRDEATGTKVVLSGDTSRRFDDDSFEAMRDPDLLVADAFVPADTTHNRFIADRISDDGLDFADKHMTYEGALDLADALGADEVALVHLSHYFDEEYGELADDGDGYEFGEET
jgi:phosphoribosyl 1,2-cyclic phosphate phosphodiesterase